MQRSGRMFMPGGRRGRVGGLRDLVIPTVLMILLGGAAAGAADHESGFGFAISVPDVWLVLTRGEVAANAPAFLAREGNAGLSSIPLAMRRIVYDRVQSGELEIFYRREAAPGEFVDNVNVLMQPAELPSARDQLDQLCGILPGEFSRVFGRPIAMDVCEMRVRAGRPALYLQFDGAIPGTTTLQYQIERGRNATLILTATSTRAHLPRMLGEFEEMVESIRLH
ncbi:MAG TPA: hypothetical protein ENI85_06335 [Deltaproteobacteria bacterium]|nr:hypothetical protein [Deltaproteobacteria bacterium]